MTIFDSTDRILDECYPFAPLRLRKVIKVASSWYVCGISPDFIKDTFKTELLELQKYKIKPQVSS